MTEGGRERGGSRIGNLMRAASGALGFGAKDPHPARRRAQSVRAPGEPDGEEVVEEEMGDVGQKRNDLSFATFRGHESSVYGCCWLPGADEFASGGRDKSLRLWKAETPSAGGRAVVKGHSGFVLSCDVSPTGKHLISGSEDSNLYMWEVQGKMIASMRGHTNKVYAASYMPPTSPEAGARVITASLDHTVRLWDVESTKQRGCLRAHTDNVFAARFSWDGSLAASGGDDKGIIVWDWRQQKEAYSLPGHRATIWSVVWRANDDELLSCGMGSELAVFCCRQRQIKYRADAVHGNTPTHQAVFSADGNTVMSCGRDKLVQLRDNAPGLPLVRSLHGHTGTVYHIDLHPDGTTLLSSSVDTTLKLWRL
eukprot:Hpha_TRINITY_DN35236_c0_g1::TRINITY_DN35236_c0_g1_i1::g.145097::m.145097